MDDCQEEMEDCQEEINDFFDIMNEYNDFSELFNSQNKNAFPSKELESKPLIQTNVQYSPHQIQSRVKFTPIEDQYLLQLVKAYGTKNWQLISRIMGNRSQRQCRDRYKHYLSPLINTTEWTPEEDRLLLEKIKIYRNKWSKIAEFFPGRTGISIRNRCCKLSRQPSSDPFLKQVLNNQQ